MRQNEEDNICVEMQGRQECFNIEIGVQQQFIIQTSTTLNIDPRFKRYRRSE
jgi:hypothetical protein